MSKRRSEYLKQYCEHCDRAVVSCPHLIISYDLEKLPCDCKPPHYKQVGGVPVTTVFKLSGLNAEPVVYQCPQCLIDWDVHNGRDVGEVRRAS